MECRQYSRKKRKMELSDKARSVVDFFESNGLPYHLVQHPPLFTIEAGLGENPLELSQLPQLLLENEPLLAAALSL